MQASRLKQTRFIGSETDKGPEYLWSMIQAKASINGLAWDVEYDDDDEPYLDVLWVPIFIEELSQDQRMYFSEPFDFDVEYDDLTATGTVRMHRFMHGYIFDFEFVATKEM